MRGHKCRAGGSVAISEVAGVPLVSIRFALGPRHGHWKKVSLRSNFCRPYRAGEAASDPGTLNDTSLSEVWGLHVMVHTAQRDPRGLNLQEPYTVPAKGCAETLTVGSCGRSGPPVRVVDVYKADRRCDWGLHHVIAAFIYAFKHCMKQTVGTGPLKLI